MFPKFEQEFGLFFSDFYLREFVQSHPEF